jgi:hypothetical protein
MDKNEQVFTDLPEALVEEALSKSEDEGSNFYKSFKELKSLKQTVRPLLEKEKFIISENELPYSEIPTTSGIDGSYVVERLLAADFVACAAVAVEGTVPPSEKSYWPSPRHRLYIKAESHNIDTGTIVRGIMMEMEMDLANESPHSVVFIDGSFSTPLIYANQSMSKYLESKEGETGKELEGRFDSFISNYKKILESNRTDKVWASVPKYTSKREIGKKFNFPSSCDDRAVLTTILQAGELTHPVDVEPPQQPYHIKLPNGSMNTSFDPLLRRVKVFYYRPFNWTPALRIEIGPSVAGNDAQLALLIRGVKAQCVAPNILEPYPLFLADRMVKNLSTAVNSFRQIATKKMIETEEDEDLTDIIFGMHGYRTEI